MRLPFSIAACLVAVLARPAAAGVDSLISVIDFEEYSETTRISSQYLSGYGVTFSLIGGGSPIIVQEGGDLVAFGTASFGVDSFMSSGSRGLTDPLGPNGGATTSPRQVLMEFNPPVTLVRFYVIDVDAGSTFDESITATAYEGAAEVGQISVAGVAANDGKSTLVEFTGTAITSVLIAPTGALESDPNTPVIGWAMDFLTIARPCPTPDCTPRFRLSQESAPNAGDFSAHVLGEIPIWITPSTSAAAFYGYGVPEGSSWNGAALKPIAQRSHLLGAVTTNGPTLVVVHDRAIPDDPDGGTVEMRFEVLNDPNGAAIVVQDDPTDGTDFYTGATGSNVFTTRQSWLTCCTDGVAIGDLACGSSVIIEFTNVDNNTSTPTILGIDEWFAYGADGTFLPLALVADRRLRVDLLPPASCPADFTCDGVIGAADLGVLLGAWGQTFGAPDIDGSGLVDAADIAELLGLWGECP